jgi:hypothetical protein
MFDALARALAFHYQSNRVLRIVPVTAPAAGADWQLVVPGDKVWEPISVVFRLVTAAVAATRVPQLAFTDGTTTWGFVNADTTQIISLTRDYSFMANFNPAGTAVNGTRIAGAMPAIVLPGGYTIGTLTEALDPADQYSNIFVTVEELLAEPPGIHERNDAFRNELVGATEAAAPPWGT